VIKLEASMAEDSAIAGGTAATPIPAVYTNQQMINAFYYAAEALGIADYGELLTRAGLNLDALAAQREAAYGDTDITTMAALSPAERAVLRRELLGELLKQVRWIGLVNAPDGLNLRPTPSTQAPPLALLSHETLLQVLAECGAWLFVVANGQDGYVYAAHVLRRIAPDPVVTTPGEPANPPDGGSTHGGSTNGGTVDFAPPPEEQVTVPPNAGGGMRVVADVWNSYGGILKQEALRLQIDPTLAAALLAAESNGRGFGPDGRLLIRFENHIFFDQWGKNNQGQFFTYFKFDPDQRWLGHQWRTDPNGEWQELHRDNQALEWQALTVACQLDETSALKSISMGLAQIMGFNYAAVGFADVQAMFRAFQTSVANQIAGFFRFIEANRLLDAVRSGDLRAFAAGYNGSGQADAYAEILRAYAAALRQLRTPAAAAAPIPALAPVPAPAAPGGVAVAAIPQPPSPQPGVPLAEADPELYAAWRRHVEQGIANNEIMFKRILDAFLGPYWTTVWTYRVLIAIGICGFILAAWFGIAGAQWSVTVIFGGLSIAAFLTFFLSRPLQALEENLQFITWLGVVYNTYWTRLVNAQNPATFQADLSAATAEFVEQLHQLVNVHAERSAKRPTIETKRKWWFF
jgi:hypothetical protein